MFCLKVVDEIKDAQMKLFAWREKFFHEKFKTEYFGHSVTTWITDGHDDSHGMDTVPYQIACKFDKVMKLASSKRILDPNKHELFYFKNDELTSSKAYKFYPDYENPDDEESDGDEESPNSCCSWEDEDDEYEWKA